MLVRTHSCRVTAPLQILCNHVRLSDEVCIQAKKEAYVLLPYRLSLELGQTKMQRKFVSDAIERFASCPRWLKGIT